MAHVLLALQIPSSGQFYRTLDSLLVRPYSGSDKSLPPVLVFYNHAFFCMASTVQPQRWLAPPLSADPTGSARIRVGPTSICMREPPALARFCPPRIPPDPPGSASDPHPQNEGYPMCFGAACLNGSHRIRPDPHRIRTPKMRDTHCVFVLLD